MTFILLLALQLFVFVAGVLFLVGKTASVAAIASIAGAYLWPEFARPIAVAAVVVLAIVNATGIRSTAVVSIVIASPARHRGRRSRSPGACSGCCRPRP